MPWLRAIMLHGVLLRLWDLLAGQEGGIMSLLTVLLHVRHVMKLCRIDKVPSARKVVVRKRRSSTITILVCAEGKGAHHLAHVEWLLFTHVWMLTGGGLSFRGIVHLQLRVKWCA